MSDKKLKYLGCICVGMFVAMFTIPLYRWALGEFSIVVAILLGFIFAHIIYKHSAFSMSEGEGLQRRRRRRRPQTIEQNRRRIYVDEYGRIFDPDDD